MKENNLSVEHLLELYCQRRNEYIRKQQIDNHRCRRLEYRTWPPSSPAQWKEMGGEPWFVLWWKPGRVTRTGITKFFAKNKNWHDIFVSLLKRIRGHSDLNQGPIGLQPIALPLSYIPSCAARESNPGRKNGNLAWYHYTSGAVVNNGILTLFYSLISLSNFVTKNCSFTCKNCDTSFIFTFLQIGSQTPPLPPPPEKG
jgi:hypothetical protein